MQTFLLKILPYLIALVVGVIIYYVTELHLAHLPLYGLLVGVASGLLSIPLIFISYESIGRICTRKLRNTLFEHLSHELNGLIIDILGELRKLLGNQTPLTPDTLDDLLETDEQTITAQLQLDTIDTGNLQSLGDKILITIQRHSHGTFDALTAEEMHTLLSIRKETTTVAREVNHQRTLEQGQQNFAHLAADVHLLFSHIAEWLEECEEEALSNHRSFRFLGSN